MAFSLTGFMFGLFTRTWQQRDSYQDSQGKGFMERYVDMLAADFDANTLPGISDLNQNVADPDEAFLQYLPYLEEMKGAAYVDGVEATRRKILKYSVRFNRIKGTKKGLETLLNLYLGLTVTVTEHFEIFSFDSATVFDSTTRRFDRNKCSQKCTEYSVLLSGEAPALTPAQVQAVLQIIAWNEPINARLRICSYNDEQLAP